MTKPKTPKAESQPVDNPAPDPAGIPAPMSTSAEGNVLVTLSSAVGVGSASPGTFAGMRGLPAAFEPAIPEALDAQLNGRERRIVWRMVNGSTYAQACRDTQRMVDGQPASQERTDAVPDAIIAAVSAVFRQVARQSGLDRGWIIEQTVALYERAARAVPVLDRAGRETGDYRFDGATAAKCLSMLAEWNGELYPKRQGGIAPSDVADLMLAVADRGRPGVEARRERVIGGSSATEQREEESL